MERMERVAGKREVGVAERAAAHHIQVVAVAHVHEDELEVGRELAGVEANGHLCVCAKRCF